MSSNAADALGIDHAGLEDGLHRGHWELIGGTQRARERLGLAADVVFTFKQHPRQLLAPTSDPFILTAWRAKLSLLHKASCQIIVAADFCEALAQLPYQEFVAKFLVGYLGMKHLVVGYDVHLGADRGGNAETLAALAELVDEGKVREIGCSNFSSEQLDEAAAAYAAAMSIRGTATGDGLADLRVQLSFRYPSS